MSSAETAYIISRFTPSWSSLPLANDLAAWLIDEDTGEELAIVAALESLAAQLRDLERQA